MNKGGGLRMQLGCRGNMQTHAHVLQNVTPTPISTVACQSKASTLAPPDNQAYYTVIALGAQW